MYLVKVYVLDVVDKEYDNDCGKNLFKNFFCCFKDEDYGEDFKDNVGGVDFGEFGVFLIDCKEI